MNSSRSSFSSPTARPRPRREQIYAVVKVIPISFDCAFGGPFRARTGDPLIKRRMPPSIPAVSNKNHPINRQGFRRAGRTYLYHFAPGPRTKPAHRFRDFGPALAAVLSTALLPESESLDQGKSNCAYLQGNVHRDLLHEHTYDSEDAAAGTAQNFAACPCF